MVEKEAEVVPEVIIAAPVKIEKVLEDQNRNTPPQRPVENHRIPVKE